MTHRPAPIDRPAVSLTHLDPPLTPTRFLANRPWAFGSVVATVTLLAWLAALDRGAVLLEIDEPVTRWVVERRSTVLTELFDRASRLGDNVVVFTLAGVVAAMTWSRCRYLAMALLLAAAFRPAMEFVLKALIDRDRPTIEPLRDFQGPSHPSGHPMAAAAFWGLVPAAIAVHVASRRLWRMAIAAAVAIVVLVGASRVYLGGHYLTDVVASLGWASLYLMVVQGTFDRFHHDRECRHSQHRTQVTGE